VTQVTTPDRLRTYTRGMHSRHDLDNFILRSSLPQVCEGIGLDHDGMSTLSFKRPFDVLIAEAHASARRFAYRLTRNRDDAEDLLQDALIAAYRGFEQFSHGSNFQAWLNRIVLNLFYKRATKLSRDRQTLELKEAILLDADGPEALDLVLTDRLSVIVSKEIDRLPEEFGDVCYRAFILTQPYDQIAAETGIPIGTVRSRIFRGRRILQQRLVDEAWIEPDAA